jgi:hypothetical protein
MGFPHQYMTLMSMYTSIKVNSQLGKSGTTEWSMNFFLFLAWTNNILKCSNTQQTLRSLQSEKNRYLPKWSLISVLDSIVQLYLRTKSFASNNPNRWLHERQIDVKLIFCRIIKQYKHKAIVLPTFKGSVSLFCGITHLYISFTNFRRFS